MQSRSAPRMSLGYGPAAVHGADVPDDIGGDDQRLGEPGQALSRPVDLDCDNTRAFGFDDEGRA